MIKQAKNTQFGKDHNFAEITNYTQWKASVPIRDYEKLKNYIQQIIDGEENVLWPGTLLFL